MVREITSKAEFDAALVDAGDKLVVVDFTATWCGPCRAIAPEFVKLAEQCRDQAVFLQVDVDKCRQLAQEQNIAAMPTFIFYKRGQLFHVFRGASVKKIQQGIETYGG